MSNGDAAGLSHAQSLKGISFISALSDEFDPLKFTTQICEEIALTHSNRTP